ncbi:hypothetical protein M406DRAFT_60049 [Cryphonectria parasitica EP155]|uniref:tRNA-splicing endonuclease subunit Sen2 n=1 Tax=Cryphonectria parasitica (strain ATCC 38755 / EP155) TaxID=660469 RepID=A0A9P4YEQ0_CRYP1|nr:uncharacterized protein M406DRAFT_60049 [Cryphonectria parasitica EP155]KAF3771389.1 hypothetical protein M406DRAFT_60049 [Cryphonectria parasitica EP155]
MPSANALATPRRPRQPPLHELYKQPAPLRVFPLPTFASTDNPVSLVQLAVAWLGQIFFPPTPEPSVIHTAFWDNGTRSIVVTDPKAMADLWQQGFYGKGSLSRSEPNWLKRESSRRGATRDRVSEMATEKRREDRVRAKWERARIEQEALEQRRREEASTLAEAAVEAVVESPAKLTRPPVGPAELLALPNSQFDLVAASRNHARVSEDSMDGTDGSMDGSGSFGNDDAETNTTVSSGSATLKRAKSVRFSPKVESTIFQLTDPPSPSRSLPSFVPENERTTKPDGVPRSDVPAEVVVGNKEHLQLAPEEAFFLCFALGALKVTDAATQGVLSTKDLLALLRQNSYFPPRVSQPLQPDDPFLIHYAVYHHFRSLGWVPRPGIKFGVDWLLYNRGPVFDHAEYGLLVLPSYAHPHWKASGRQASQKSWHWLMGVNRVLSKVFKSLVLVYVDVPPPTAFNVDGEPRMSMAALLKQYQIREQMIKRWSPNRDR